MTATKARARTTKPKSKPKTAMAANGASVDAYLARVSDPARRADCLTLVRIMAQVTNEDPTMWGKGLVGFGRYHYVYASGHEGDCFLAGFAPPRATSRSTSPRASPTTRRFWRSWAGTRPARAVSTSGASRTWTSTC